MRLTGRRCGSRCSLSDRPRTCAVSGHPGCRSRPGGRPGHTDGLGSLAGKWHGNVRQPGSGKSTLARSLARRLGLPAIDKDVILESLYDSLGVGDHAWRNRLSRASDDIMFASAADAGRRRDERTRS
ncbi:cytidylate kinase family protein (plasmid) [Streptomyces sp. NBC_01005]|nr:cytidylate kinase family protein [Streptomyces sp. NBC_01005]WTD00771.1 cytidylate kinase family protein [Streptomyces sp. NBC_01650]